MIKFTEEEVSKAVDSCDSNKAVGTDFVDFSIFQKHYKPKCHENDNHDAYTKRFAGGALQLRTATVRWLTKQLNQGIVPESTDITRQLTLSKTSTSQASLDQIRVICISSHLRKALEKAILHKIWLHNKATGDDFLVTEKYQQGFKEEGETSVQIARFMRTLFSKEAKYHLAIDFSQAFDTVSRDKLCYILAKQTTTADKSEEKSDARNDLVALILQLLRPSEV